MEEFIARSYAFSVIMTVFVGLVAMGLLIYRDLPVYDQHLARRFARTRLHAVLLHLGLAPRAYAEAAGPDALRSQMRRCQRCDETRECDAAIADSRAELPLAGCLNREEIRHFQ